jgi:hypothetical protein
MSLLLLADSALVVGTGAMAAGLFGMNLEVEQSTAAWMQLGNVFDRFELVSLGIFTFSGVVGLACPSFLLSSLFLGSSFASRSRWWW